MRQYHSDNKNYNAILDAMAQIRQNQLNESYGYYAEEDDEEQMYEMSDEEEMEEEQMSDDEAEMVAEMLDEALAEIYEEDDEDNHQLDEADGGERRARRRRNYLRAAAIGAGIIALGGAGAAGMGMLPGQFGQQAVQGAIGAAGTLGQNLASRGAEAARRGKIRFDAMRSGDLAAAKALGAGERASVGVTGADIARANRSSQVQRDLRYMAQNPGTGGRRGGKSFRKFQIDNPGSY